MPRFGQYERQRIQERLLQEGEKLFLAHGLAKVTIDELALAAGIAKATFYGFYENKEALFLDIAMLRQREVFAQVEAVLVGNAGQAGKMRVLEAFAALQTGMQMHPILSRIDAETTERVARRVSQEQLSAFASQNLDAARVMQAHGIVFLCDVEIVSQAFLALYHSWMALREQGATHQVQVTRLLLCGLVDQIIAQ